MTARHSMDSAEWYTPEGYVEAAREVMGTIDLDPASHEEANRVVRAGRFLTAEEDGLSRVWEKRVFLNPPGGLVKEFWAKLVWWWVQGTVEQAVWIGYSLEQLQTLQGVASWHPLDFPMCVPKRRIAFVENEAKEKERLERLRMLGKFAGKASSPSHGNYITYIGQEKERFAEVFSRFGHVRV